MKATKMTKTLIAGALIVISFVLLFSEPVETETFASFCQVFFTTKTLGFAFAYIAYKLIGKEVKWA